MDDEAAKGGRMVPDSLIAEGGFIPPLYHLPTLADPTPLTRRKRFRYWRRGAVIRTREKAALTLAPWLERHDDW